jgi:hypothetical protein
MLAIVSTLGGIVHGTRHDDDQGNEMRRRQMAQRIAAKAG